MPARSRLPSLAASASARLSANTSLAGLPLSAHDNLALLRRQWKWAAFCQFFYTFAALFNMPDVAIPDIEEDLTRSGAILLPRVVVRLLHTLTQDKKINLDNWQTALRKQFTRRDPDANPLAPEPEISSSPPPESPPPTDGVTTADITNVNTPQTSAMEVDGESVALEEIRPEASAEPPASTPAEAPASTNGKDDTHSQAGDERPIDWLELPMLAKLDTIHLLTEWQFHNVNRFRSTMRSDDEEASWRIEPIGYDAKTNAYWLIAENRLWIQRQPPKPPARKRKRAPAASSGGRKAKRAATERAEPAAKKPARSRGRAPARTKKGNSSASAAASPAPRSRAPARSRTSTRHSGASSPAPPPVVNGVRAAKVQANMKLDAQAKQLAELKRRGLVGDVDAGGSGRGSPGRRPLGTRMSARLRGAGDEDDEEWQQLPDEWAGGDTGGEKGEKAEGRRGTRTSARAQAKTHPVETPLRAALARGKAIVQEEREKEKVESDEESLSDLTDLESDEPEEEAKDEEVEDEEPEESVKAEEEEPEEEPWTPPADFVEWETIAITLYEWEHVADRFQGATHYLEKALYKVLAQHVVPVVTGELKDIERKRQIEEALMTRKRSSRIAVKETQKEEARAAAMRREEEEKQRGREKRLEARQKKEEEERAKRESAREQRRKEREVREEAMRLRKDQPPESADADVDVVGNESPAANGARPSRPANGTSTGTSSRSGDDWELDCEICHRRGINQDDGIPMMSCASCSRWQHIQCHDKADRAANRAPRNWEKEEFICQRCRHAAQAKASRSSSHSHPHTHRQQAPPPTNGSAYALPPATHHASLYHNLPGRQMGAGTPPLPHPNQHQQHQQSPAYAWPQQSHVPQGHGPSASHQAQAYPSRAGVSFTHYQPDQQHFSVASPPHAHGQPQQQGQNGMYAYGTHGYGAPVGLQQARGYSQPAHQLAPYPSHASQPLPGLPKPHQSAYYPHNAPHPSASSSEMMTHMMGPGPGPSSRDPGPESRRLAYGNGGPGLPPGGDYPPHHQAQWNGHSSYRPNPGVPPMQNGAPYPYGGP